MAKRDLQFLPQRGVTEPVSSAVRRLSSVSAIPAADARALGLELQSVANQLRIRLSYLEAIEDGRYSDLPGTTYAVGFVRSYADYLELDGADIVRRFREEVARIHGRTRLIFPALTAEGKLPPRRRSCWCRLIGLAVVYGVWYYISSASRPTSHGRSPEVPDRLVVLDRLEPERCCGRRRRPRIRAAISRWPSGTSDPPPGHDLHGTANRRGGGTIGPPATIRAGDAAERDRRWFVGNRPHAARPRRRTRPRRPPRLPPADGADGG